MTPSKPINYIAPMIAFALCLLFLSRYVEFPSASSPLPTSSVFLPSSSPPPTLRPQDPFTDLITAFSKWDLDVGCTRFRDKHSGWAANASSVQILDDGDCKGLRLRHVSVLVKGWTWIPDNLDNLYSCRCGLSCLWTKSPVLADRPDALLFETTMPPSRVALVLLTFLEAFIDFTAHLQSSYSIRHFLVYLSMLLHIRPNIPKIVCFDHQSCLGDADL